MNHSPSVDVIVRNPTNATGRTISVHITFPPGAESADPVVTVKSARGVISSDPEPLPPPPAIKAENTFDNFIVGPENEIAYAAAAAAVAASPGKRYNPLLIYGKTGLGKTHLLHAIAHRMLRSNPRARIVYITCEAFAYEHVTAGRTDFKRKYREADLVLLDDIQSLSGRTGTQAAVLEIFDHLQLNHRQVILTSDRPVKEIRKLSDQFVSRFQGGMTAAVSMPGLETRMAIVERKAQNRGVSLTPELIEFIASRIVRNVRNLDGAITRVAGYGCLEGDRKLSVDHLKLLLHDILLDEGDAPILIDRIMRKVAERYDLSVYEITDNRLPSYVVWPRQVAMYLATRCTDLSLAAIGRAFGGRDEGFVHNACEIVQARMNAYPWEKCSVEVLLNQFDGGV